MSGSYQGKDWAPLESLYNIYEIEDRKTTTYFIAEIQRIYTKDINNKLEQERKAQEDVSISISEEQDRFEAEEANIAKTLLEQNKKAAAEGNDAQIFRNNMRAIKSAMESPTLATSVIDALAGAGEGAAELEKEIKETNKELDVQFQEQAKESRSRKRKLHVYLQ